MSTKPNADLVLLPVLEGGELPGLAEELVRELGVNSIEFQQTVQRDFQQSVWSYRVSCDLLKILLNVLLKFN